MATLTGHRSEHPRSCSFQVLFFVLTNLFFISNLFNNILFVSYFHFFVLFRQSKEYSLTNENNALGHVSGTGFTDRLGAGKTHIDNKQINLYTDIVYIRECE